MLSTNALIRRLDEDATLRRVCGFGRKLPYRTTFNRFITRLGRYQDLIDDCMAVLVTETKKVLPGLGEKVAIDSTTARSHSHPNRGGKGNGQPSDPQASWMAKTSTRGKRETDWFWAYKLHLVADATYGIP